VPLSSCFPSPPCLADNARVCYLLPAIEHRWHSGSWQLGLACMLMPGSPCTFQLGASTGIQQGFLRHVKGCRLSMCEACVDACGFLAALLVQEDLQHWRTKIATNNREWEVRFQWESCTWSTPP
jgi:hypothetical protein